MELGIDYLTTGPGLANNTRVGIREGFGVEKLRERNSEALEPFALSIAFNCISPRHRAFSCSLT